MKKKKNLNLHKKYLWIALLCLLFIITSASSFAYFTYQKVVIKNDPFESLNLGDDSLQVEEVDPLDPYNILLLGFGGQGHSGGEITDTMIVANVQPRKKIVTLISIPRDIWVPLFATNGTILYKKINHAYALGNDNNQYLDRPEKYTGELGGALLAEDSVELVTGLEIRHFAAINFQAFEQAINNLGGITTNVPSSFIDDYYPIKGLEEDPCGKTEEEISITTATMSGFKLEQEFKCRFERLEFTAGPTQMDGGTALKFVRSRHSETNGNDFARAERQQAVVQAIRDKLLSLGTLPKLVPLINTLASNVRTDIGIGTIRQIWSTHEDLATFTLKTLVLSDDNVLTDSRSTDRQYILIPKSGEENWDEIHHFITTQLATDSAVLQE